MRLRSWLEQNADSGGSMNAKSHITTFKWRHINAFPVHLSSNNSLEQCAVHAHEIVFFSREAWTVLPWRAFWIGVLNQRFKTLILPSQNKHERSLSHIWTLRSYISMAGYIHVHYVTAILVFFSVPNSMQRAVSVIFENNLLQFHCILLLFNKSKHLSLWDVLGNEYYS